MAAVGRSKLTRSSKPSPASKSAARRAKIAAGIDAIFDDAKLSKSERAFVRGAVEGYLEESAKPQKKGCGGCAGGGCSRAELPTLREASLDVQVNGLRAIVESQAALGKSLQNHLTQVSAQNGELTERLMELVVQLEAIADENQRLRKENLKLRKGV